MKRPFSVTLLALAVLLFAIYNAVRTAIAIYALNQLDFLTDLDIRTPVIVLMVIGIDWAIGFTLAAIGLWRLKAWGRQWMIIALIAYEILIWIERLTLEQSPYEQLTRPGDVAITLLVAVSTVGFFFMPRIRRVFQTEQP
ncbi:MAG TPA: hypothetical protein VFF70_07185 [Anaerolineae bacterium]|nr:hypothetical protein [Anaerolineae bacterium]